MSFFKRKPIVTPRQDLTVIHSAQLVRDSQGAPAVVLTKDQRDTHVSLAKRYDKVGFALDRRGLGGVRAQVLMYVDHSGSMEDPGGYYGDGSVQHVTERALGFGLRVDVDGIIPVMAFDHRLHTAVDAGMGNYAGIVDREIWKPRQMGGTNYCPILEDVRRRAEYSDLPVVVIICTDGAPWDGPEAQRLICELSRYPVFIKFLAFEEVEYLRKLDDLEETMPGARLIDNVDVKFFDGQRDDQGRLWPRIADIADMQFAEAMVDEWNTWLEAALGVGLLIPA